MSYILSTQADRRAMLASIGAASVAELFATVPAEVRLDRPLDVPPALTEIELTRHLHALAARNQSAADAVCFLGGGAYDHFIPAVVDAMAGRSEFYTAYTPYQAEASQGTLQAVFEFQTLICQLTGMEVANASLYEGGTRRGRGGAHGRRRDRPARQGARRRERPPRVPPDARDLRRQPRAEVVTVPTPHGFLDPDDVKKAVDDQTACVVVQTPTSSAAWRRSRPSPTLATEVGALFIVSFDPISLGLLKRPGAVRGRHRRGRGAGAGQPARVRRAVPRHPGLPARSTSARSPAGSSARRWTATASGAGC